MAIIKNKNLTKRKLITYVIGIIAFTLPLILYFSPPTDSDGGPMMAYNFLFFYPVAFLAIILSLIVTFRIKSFKKDLISKALLVLSIIPTLILTSLILLKFYRISNEPPYDLNLEIHNNTINLQVNDTLAVNLHGFVEKKLNSNDEIIEVKKINIIPYIHHKYSFKDGGYFKSKSANNEVYYKLKNDSLIIYSRVGFEYFNKTRLPLPFFVSKLDIKKETKEEMTKNGFKKFVWK